METLTNFKADLPCVHVWKFELNPDGAESYFECSNCHKQVPYDPAELADIEEEMNHG